MAELLLIKPQEIASTTPIGGNVDIDKYVFLINSVQITVIEPLLGTELYDKIISDIEGSTLTGLYLELYDDLIKPILKNQTTAEYIEICSYTVDNGGVYKHQADDEQTPERKSVEAFAGKYRGVAGVYVERFKKWICKNPLPEYKTYQDEVNANIDVNLIGGWYLGSTQNPTKWEKEAGYCDNCNNNIDCCGCYHR